jgi:hypothetical protein
VPGEDRPTARAVGHVVARVVTDDAEPRCRRRAGVVAGVTVAKGTYSEHATVSGMWSVSLGGGSETDRRGGVSGRDGREPTGSRPSGRTAGGFGRRRLLRATAGGVLGGTALVPVATSGTLAQDQGTVVGTVTDQEGSAVPNATVTLADGGTAVATDQTDTDGQYGLSAEPGTYDLTVEKSGFSTFQDAVTIEESGETVSVDVTLEPPDPGAVIGVVTDEFDNRLSGAQIVLLENNSQVAATTSDGDGQYALAASPGEYVVEITKGGFKPVSQTATITSAEATLVNATLPAGPPSLPGFDNPPQDLDNDGLFEDVDGNGVFDIFDVQALFTHLDSIAVQNNPAAFNFGDDTNPSDVTIFDVQALFDRLE